MYETGDRTRQYKLDLEPAAGRAVAPRRVWIVASQDASDAEAADLLARPHLFIAAENGAPAIGSRDVIVLRRSCGLFEVFAPDDPTAQSADQSLWHARVSDWLAARANCITGKSLDLVLVSRAACEREHPKIVSTSTHLERLFAQIAAPGMLAGHPRRAQLCESAWRSTIAAGDRRLRALLRVESDRIPHRRSARQMELLEAVMTLRSEGLAELAERLLRPLGSRDDRQITMPWCETPPHKLPRLGYVVRSFGALCLTDWADPSSWSSPSEISTRRRSGAFIIERAALIKVVSRVSSRVVRMNTAIRHVEQVAAGAVLRVTMDWEFRTLLGVAGVCSAGDKVYDVQVSSRTCEVSPSFLRCRIGEAGEFSLRASSRGPHRVRVAAQDGFGKAVVREVRAAFQTGRR